MMRARAARSASADGTGGGTAAWRLKVVGGMIGSLFLRSYERSERVYAAMLARGFDGELRHMHGRSLTASDWVLFGSALTAIALFGVAGQIWLAHA
jgi:cobalt/nickel transport system permease protein